MTVYTCTCHADLEHLARLRCILACIMCEYIYICCVSSSVMNEVRGAPTIKQRISSTVEKKIDDTPSPSVAGMQAVNE